VTTAWLAGHMSLTRVTVVACELSCGEKKLWKIPIYIETCEFLVCFRWGWQASVDMECWTGSAWCL